MEYMEYWNMSAPSQLCGPVTLTSVRDSPHAERRRSCYDPTRPYDPQHGRSLLFSLSQIDSLATRAAARGQYVLKVSIKVVHKTSSVILYLLTGPVTAKKLAD